jgi:hypothetical protein
MHSYTLAFEPHNFIMNNNTYNHAAIIINIDWAAGDHRLPNRICIVVSVNRLEVFQSVSSNCRIMTSSHSRGKVLHTSCMCVTVNPLYKDHHGHMQEVCKLTCQLYKITLCIELFNVMCNDKNVRINAWL